MGATSSTKFNAGEELLEHAIRAAELDHLSSLRTRRALRRDAHYRRLRPEIERVLDGFEWSAQRPPPTLEKDTVRAVAWNVERGKRFEPLLGRLTTDAELSAADLFLLTEVDIGMGRSGNRNIPRELARALGTNYVYVNQHLVLAPGDVGELDGGPNTLALHGAALLSRHPIVRADAVILPEFRDKFRATEKRLGSKRALIAEVMLPDGPLTVAVVHLDPFAPPRFRAWQMKLILARIARFGARRILLGGDFNTSTYNLASGPSLVANILDKLVRIGVEGIVAEYLDPRKGREAGVFNALTDSGLVLESFNQLGRGTLFCDPAEEELERKALEYMPKRLYERFKKLLDPWDGVLPLHIDWFAGYGLRADHADVIVRPRFQGEMISDHSPILVDLALHHEPAPPFEHARVVSRGDRYMRRPRRLRRAPEGRIRRRFRRR